METRERNSINYNNTPQSNQDSSPRLNTAPLKSSLTSNIRTYETINHHHQTPLHQPASLPLTTTRLVVGSDVVRYRECLKNHAANMGTHVLDGCGEFMPSGADDTPQALKCAACDCHRSFHRREVEGVTNTSQHTHHVATRGHAATVHIPMVQTTQTLRQHHRMSTPIMMAFGGANGAAAESSSEDLNIFQTYAGMQLMAQTSKKRFRTKFTQEQKDKMFDYAERIGWKIQKQDEQDVLRFCNEVGLKKQVFKVWMHNNKQSAKKK